MIEMPTDVAERVEKYRLDRLWTMYQLANATGIPRTTLNNIIAKRHKPNRLTVAKLMKALPHLFDGDGDGHK